MSNNWNSLSRCLLGATLLVLAPCARTAGDDISIPAERNTHLVQMIRKSRPSVVSLLVRTERGARSGSGTIIHPKGYALTNHHVVKNRLGYVLIEGRRLLPFQPVGSVPELDLAVIQIRNDGKEPFSTISLGQSNDLQMGEDIINLGNPGGRGVVATRGIISSPSMRLRANAVAMAGRTLDELDRYIQFDATSNPGNSGGALLTADGLQVGVVSGYLSKENNVNLAIPISRFHDSLSTLLSTEIVKEFVTGLTVEERDGKIFVASVKPDSPARQAGLKVNDQIVKWQGQQLRSHMDYQFAVHESTAGQPNELLVASNHQERKVTLTPSVRKPLAAVAAIDDKNVQPGLQCVVDHLDEDENFPFRNEMEIDQQFEVPHPEAQPAGLTYKDHYRLQFSGLIRVDEAGLYRFSIGSDDGSRFSVHGRQLINNDGHHPLRFRGGLARLERGWHPIQIDFFEFGGDEELEFRLNTEDGSPIELGRQHFGHRAAAPADAP